MEENRILDVTVISEEWISALRHLLRMCKEKEEDRQEMFCHWSKLRRNVSEKLQCLSNDNKNEYSLLSCENATVIGGLTVATCALGLMHSMVMGAGAAVVMLGLTTMGVAKGYKEAEFKRIDMLLLQAEEYIKMDLRETLGILKLIRSEIEFLEEIKNKILVKEMLEVEVNGQRNLEKSDYIDIIQYLDLWLEGSSRNCCKSYLNQCLLLCNTKQNFLCEMLKLLSNEDGTLPTTDSVKYEFNSLKEMVYNFSQSSITVPNKHTDTYSDYELVEAEECDGFTLIEKKDSTSMVSSNSNMQSTSDYNTISPWLSKKSSALADSLEKVMKMHYTDVSDTKNCNVD